MPIRSAVDMGKYDAWLAGPHGTSETQMVLEVAVEPVLFAGGATCREHDPFSAIRPTAVLGQVRFFWRLLQPDQALATLKDNETRLFGAASLPDMPRDAPFSLRVTPVAKGEIVPVPGVGRPGGYLAFAGRRDNAGNPEAKLSTGVKARLTFTFRDTPDESVLAAIRAWSLLGGVGGRTRRGLGAVQVTGGPATRDALIAELRAIMAPSPRNAKCGGALRSIAQIHVGRAYGDPDAVLMALEHWYKTFRQHRRPGTPPTPGRSYWDEPEEIRVLLGERLLKHAPLPRPQGQHPPGFARAVLGLPIVTKFKDDQGPPRNRDPAVTMLVGDGSDRMASPLLFRAVRIGKQAVPVVAILSGPYVPTGGLVLRSEGNEWPVPITPNPDAVFSELLAWNNNPLGLTRV